MTFQVKLLPDTACIEVLYGEAVSASDLATASREALRAMKVAGVTHAVADLSATRQVDASTFSVFQLPNQLYAEEGASHGIRIAVVVPADPAIRDLAKFYESACLNRGWQVCVLESRDAAMAWLDC